LKKVVLVTEYLNPPYDEGIKKTVYNLFLDLDKNYELVVFCRFGFQKDNIHILNTNPLFFSKEIKIIIKNFNPDSLIYLPFQSSTFASYLRLKVLSSFAKTKNIMFIALQPKPLKQWQKLIVKFLRPKFALTPSPTLNKFWDKMKINNELVPLLTDLSIFKPISNLKIKDDLRRKYNLPINSFIISHMGHLNEGRNLKTLIPLQQAGVQIIIAASSSTPEDAKGQESLKNELLNSGIIILDGYIENIEEVYQLSDIYIFPVIKKNSSIGMPLSILEARACSIPVITTNYGSIESYMQDDFGGIIYADPKFFLKSINELKNSENKNYAKTRVSGLNDMFYKTVHKQIEK
jgi:glycosyltransferase involved in cell wall biosynthesis